MKAQKILKPNQSWKTKTDLEESGTLPQGCTIKLKSVSKQYGVGTKKQIETNRTG